MTFNDTDTPNIVDFRTTIELNLILRRQRVEMAQLTYTFGQLMSANAAGLMFGMSLASEPTGGFSVRPRLVTRGGGAGGRKTPLLPRLSQTTQDQIAALRNEHPGLSNVNAERALRGPPGAIAKLSGKGGTTGTKVAKQPKVADIEFLNRTPKGNVVLRREVKVFEGTQGRFNAAVSDAKDQLFAGGSGGEVLVQVPEGTNARAWYKVSREPAECRERRRRIGSAGIARSG